MLARWMVRADLRPTEIHVRTMQREVRLAGMRTAEEIHAACALLVDANWLLAAPKPHGMARAKPKRLTRSTRHSGTHVNAGEKMHRRAGAKMHHGRAAKLARRQTQLSCSINEPAFPS